MPHLNRKPVDFAPSKKDVARARYVLVNKGQSNSCTDVLSIEVDVPNCADVTRTDVIDAIMAKHDYISDRSAVLLIDAISGTVWGEIVTLLTDEDDEEYYIDEHGDKVKPQKSDLCHISGNKYGWTHFVQDIN